MALRPHDGRRGPPEGRGAGDRGAPDERPRGRTAIAGRGPTRSGGRRLHPPRGRRWTTAVAGRGNRPQPGQARRLRHALEAHRLRRRASLIVRLLPRGLPQNQAVRHGRGVNTTAGCRPFPLAPAHGSRRRSWLRVTDRRAGTGSRQGRSDRRGDHVPQPGRARGSTRTGFLGGPPHELRVGQVGDQPERRQGRRPVPTRRRAVTRRGAPRQGTRTGKATEGRGASTSHGLKGDLLRGPGERRGPNSGAARGGPVRRPRGGRGPDVSGDLDEAGVAADIPGQEGGCPGGEAARDRPRLPGSW
jgi:hypothetical protein